jgi:uncharacterized membrane protein YiaA
MDGWIALWKTVMWVSVVGFYALVAVVIPFGALDCLRLVRDLSQAHKDSAATGEAGDAPEQPTA